MPDTAQMKLREAGLMTRLDQVIADAAGSMAAKQRGDGHWAFELEADVTISAEYIMLEHFLDDIDERVETDLADMIRSLQGAHGGWPLFYGGEANLSATVKAYLALRLVGDDAQAPHMRRAREVVLSLGGAEKSNVFTRYALALFGQVPWRAVPVMPVELMLLPKWFPVTVWRFSYWSRTVIVPLLVLAALKPRARNPRGVTLSELFRRPPFEIRNFHKGGGKNKFWAFFFLGLDRVLRVVEPYFPKGLRQRAITRAVDYFTERLNGEDGLGAIFPAMANVVMAMDAMGYDHDDARYATARRASKGLLVKGASDGKTFCQPCVSPVWDTALAAHALLETGADPARGAIPAATKWLRDLQVLDVVGDWAVQRPNVRPGGWAFQYRNDHFPDVDDTAVVGMLLDREKKPANAEANKEAIARAAEWIVGMQSANGGWGSFDADNNKELLNNIPFADHGALLDQPTEDVTARCVSFLAQIGPRYGYGRDHPAACRGLEYLLHSQQEDGSWWGRWGTNYIYGTWSVLSALNIAGDDRSAPHIRRAVQWLLDAQRADGGWGEDGATYSPETRDLVKESTASQTAWALLGLMAAGEVHHPAVARGIEYLLDAPRGGDKWAEPWFTAVGFPRVFYLRYDGYSRFFPIHAMARYRNFMVSNSRDVAYGI